MYWNQFNLQRRRARALTVASVTMVALSFAILSAPSQSAQAASLACDISPGLQASAAREGISCVGAGDISSPTGYNWSPVTSACNYGLKTGDLPEGVFDFTKYGHSEFSSLEYPEGPVSATTYKNGDRVTGDIAYVKRPDHTWRLIVENRIVPGWVQLVMFDCSTSREGPTYQLKEAPDIHVTADGHMYLAPPATTSPTDNEPWLAPTDTRITAVPGRPGDYLVRINLTNSASQDSPAHLSIATSSYSVEDVLSIAPGAACAALEATEGCDFPDIEGLQTQTIVLHVKAKPGVAAGTPLNTAIGGTTLVHGKLWSGDPSGRHSGFGYIDYTFDMPSV